MWIISDFRHRTVFTFRLARLNRAWLHFVMIKIKGLTLF